MKWKELEKDESGPLVMPLYLETGARTLRVAPIEEDDPDARNALTTNEVIMKYSEKAFGLSLRHENSTDFATEFQDRAEHHEFGDDFMLNSGTFVSNLRLFAQFEKIVTARQETLAGIVWDIWTEVIQIINQRDTEPHEMASRLGEIFEAFDPLGLRPYLDSED